MSVHSDESAKSRTAPEELQVVVGLLLDAIVLQAQINEKLLLRMKDAESENDTLSKRVKLLEEKA